MGCGGLGEALRIHGHGLVERCVWGRLEAEGPPQARVILLRRYRCQACRTILRVGPQGLASRRLYDLGTIAWALTFWAIVGVPARVVRSEASPWRRVGATAAGQRWVTLLRWAGASLDGALLGRTSRSGAGTLRARLAAGLGGLRRYLGGFTLGPLDPADAYRVGHQLQ